MIELKKLKGVDLIVLNALKNNRTYVNEITSEQIAALESAPYAYSLFIDGKLIMCGGVAEYWKGRGEAWAILHPDAKKYSLSLHKAALHVIESCPVNRIEAGIDVNLWMNHKWVQALGFELEVPLLREFFPDGKHASLYTKLKSSKSRKGKSWQPLQQ